MAILQAHLNMHAVGAGAAVKERPVVLAELKADMAKVETLLLTKVDGAGDQAYPRSSRGRDRGLFL